MMQVRVSIGFSDVFFYSNLSNNTSFSSYKLGLLTCIAAFSE